MGGAAGRDRGLVGRSRFEFTVAGKFQPRIARLKLRLQRIPAAIDQEIRDALPRLDGIDGRPAEEPAKRSQLGAQRISFRSRGQYLLCGEFDAAHRVINKSPRYVCVW